MKKRPTLLKCAFHDDVCIVPYQAEWPRRFRLTKQLIIALLLEDDMECYVRHVGGTAIPRHVWQAHRGCAGTGRA